MKISKKRLTQIIKEELKENFYPEEQVASEQAKAQEAIDKLKEATEQLKLIAGSETTHEYSADDESNLSGLGQSISIIEVEIAKIQGAFQAERHSYSQYKQ